MELQGYKIIGTLEYGKVFSKVWLIVWDIFNAILVIVSSIAIVDLLQSGESYALSVIVTLVLIRARIWERVRLILSVLCDLFSICLYSKSSPVRVSMQWSLSILRQQHPADHFCMVRTSVILPMTVTLEGLEVLKHEGFSITRILDIKLTS